MIYIRKEIKSNIRWIVFSWTWLICFALGHVLIKYNTTQYIINHYVVTLLGVLLVVMVGLLIGVLLGHLFYFLEKGINKSKPQWNFLEHRNTFFIIWALLFISWIPCLLAFWPGNSTYDIAAQDIMSKYHPPLHTLIWYACLFICSIIKIDATLLYALFQMLVLSLCLTYVLKFFIKKRINNIIIVLSFLFFSVNPAIAIFAITTTKDVIFTAVFVVMTIRMIIMISDPKEFFEKKSNIVMMIIIITIASLLKNNAIYSFLFSTPFFLIAIKNYRKKIGIMLLISIISFFIINGPIYNSIGIKDGPDSEMMSIPMQQISRVVVNNYNELSANDKKTINIFITCDKIKKKYKQNTADPIKFNIDNDTFENNKELFMNEWSKLLVKYPVDYTDAFLHTNLPSWCPFTPYKTQIDNFFIETDAYFHGEYYAGYRFKENSKLKKLLAFYKKFAKYEYCKNNILLNIIFAISTPFWFLLLCFFSLIKNDKRKIILVLLPQLFLWMTHLAGPLSNFRYMLPLFAMYPIFLVIVLQPYNLLKKDDKE